MTIGVSIWVLVDSPSFANFLDVINADFPVWRTGAIILIVISCLVFILTLFGCVGASRESKCMLGTVSDYRAVYLEVSPKIEVLYMLFVRYHTKKKMSRKQHIKYLYFRSKMQLNHCMLSSESDTK